MEYNIALFKLGVKNGENIFFGNAAKRHILKRIQLDKAEAVIVAIDNPKKLLTVCESIRQISDHENIIVRVSEKNEVQTLKHLGINNIVVESQEMAKVIVDRVNHL